MFRSLWQNIKDRVYNAIASLFYTQAEIDTETAARLAGVATVTDDFGEVPADARRRKSGLFVNPDDAIEWLDRNHIPSAYVTILELPDYEDDNTWFQVYVIDGGSL